MITRRNFIKTNSIAALGMVVITDKVFSIGQTRPLTGLQLYSVREDMMIKPSETLNKLAKIGYVYIEHANYVDRKFYGYASGEFKKVLDDLGLKMISGHTVLQKEHWDEGKKDFSDSWKMTIYDAGILQQKYIISPSLDKKIRRNYDLLMHYLDLLNKCGELCRKQGIKFGYHNHGFEFKEKLKGKSLFDIMMKTLDPELVVFQLDVGNTYNGGARALEIVNQNPERFEIVHVKDMIKTWTGYESTTLGKGIIKCKDLVNRVAEISGTKWFIVEQEQYQGNAPIDCVREDLEAMIKWGYYPY